MSQADNRNTTKFSRRGALAGLAGAVAAGTAVNSLARAVAAPSAPDPIFDAIKYERDCHVDYRITGAIQSKVSDQRPDDKPRVRWTEVNVAWWAEYEKAEEVHVAASQKWWAAQEALLQTQPTSLAGLIAFLDHLDAHCDSDGGWIDEWAELAFPTIASAVRELIGGVAVQTIA
jgi:hypothetical protein